MAETMDRSGPAAVDEPVLEQKNEHVTKIHQNVVDHARAATDKERKMTLLQGIRLYPKAIMFSVIISTCIIMEGYDICLINNFYAFSQFNRKYGVQLDDGTYEIPPAWQAGLSNVS